MYICQTIKQINQLINQKFPKTTSNQLSWMVLLCVKLVSNVPNGIAFSWNCRCRTPRHCESLDFRRDIAICHTYRLLNRVLAKFMKRNPQNVQFRFRMVSASSLFSVNLVLVSDYTHSTGMFAFETYQRQHLSSLCFRALSLMLVFKISPLS